VSALGGLSLTSFAFAQNKGRPNFQQIGLRTGRQYLISGHRSGGEYLDQNKQQFLAAFDLIERNSITVPVNTDIHSIVKRPGYAEELLTISKNMPKATFFPSVTDLTQQRLMHAGQGRIFSGHGAYSLDGSMLVTSETNAQMDIGILALRDPKTLEVIEVIDSGGIFPHELKFLDSYTVAVANGGSRSQIGANLAIIDLRTKKVLDRHIPPQTGPGVRHFVVDDRGHLVMGTWVTYANPDGRLPYAQALSSQLGKSEAVKIVELGKEFNALASRPPTQFLSVGLHRTTGLAVLTTLGSDLVVIVDCQSGVVRKILPQAFSSSVTATNDPNLMAVSNAQGLLQFLDMKELSWRPELERNASFLSGSHMELITIG
jgi:hypothetical protein